jgi:mono/diheme cytochrome c family protein
MKGEQVMKRKTSLAATAFFIAAAFTCVTVPGVSAGGSDKYGVRGQKLYAKYCASCHGADARGQGPVAAALKVGPPDLTMIQSPGQKFPFARVLTIINGERDLPAHGTRKMPVWGAILRRSKGDLESQLEIYTLARYIESIQTGK